ncbi:MAG: M48 family metallopeptidase, partial [bacterium]|nr:M48 family metallopeptidase [bacterium]
ELCHLKERNHGKGFWSLVAGVVPDYALRRKELRNFERLITSADTNILMDTNLRMATNKIPATNISSHS